MKFRNGFVSNSSSSSFIAFGKPPDIAESMIQTMIDSPREMSNHVNLVGCLQKLNEARLMPDVVSGYYGLCFDAGGGYDAKVYRKDDATSFVYTSNYYPWYENLMVDEYDDAVDCAFTGLYFVWISKLQLFRNNLLGIYNLNAKCKICKGSRVYSVYPTIDNKYICQNCKSILEGIKV